MIEKLSPQHQRFVYAYCSNLNKTKAYLTAYPDSSLPTARDSAYKLFNKQEIKDAIEQVLATELETQKTILKRLVTLIEFDLTEYTVGDTIDIEKIRSSGLGWIVKGIRPTKYGTEIYLIDKDKVLEMLSKAYNIFSDASIEIDFKERLNAEQLLNDQLESIRVKLKGNSSP
jgi:hypothetical protein